MRLEETCGSIYFVLAFSVCQCPRKVVTSDPQFFSEKVLLLECRNSIFVCVSSCFQELQSLKDIYFGTVVYSSGPSQHLRRGRLDTLMLKGGAL